MVENIRSKQAHMTLNAPQFQVTISCEERVLFGFPCFEKQDAERCVCVCLWGQHFGSEVGSDQLIQCVVVKPHRVNRLHFSRSDFTPVVIVRNE